MDVQAIHFPDWAVVLPVTCRQTVVMIHQYRHGNEQICLELPGGLVDPADGSPEKSAHRELMEETGYRADRIIPLGVTYPQPAVLSNRCFFFLAEDVMRVDQMTLDAGEDIALAEVSLGNVRAWIQNGKIDNAMTILAFTYYWMMRSSEK